MKGFDWQWGAIKPRGVMGPLVHVMLHNNQWEAFK